jgi:hypothetical protein
LTKCPTLRARGRLDSHRQKGFFRGLRFAPFRGRVSSLQPPVTRAVGRLMSNEKNLKKILAFLWFSLLVVACGSVSPALPTLIPTKLATVTPVVTSLQQFQATATSIISYTSTPSKICPSYGSDGPSVYLDEYPAFVVREGPGCEYEPAHPIPFKDDPLASFDILEKQGDWLLVDLCNNERGWIFAPAIDDINIHLDSDDFPVTPGVSPTNLALPIDKGSINQAKDTLINFFDLLYYKKYEEAAEIFTGGYGMIIMWNPDVNPQDHSSLLKTACEYNDFQCSLRVSQVVKEEQISRMEYHFTVEFIKEDESIYERPDNNGEMVSQFLLHVVKDCNGKYFVVDWPFYGF